jgi:RNA polymerase sigma-70 factor (ECF subfamily)
MANTDADLVQQCLAGYCDAYNELVQRHQDAVFNLLMKMTGNWHEAADLTQEAFIRAYRKLSAYDSQFSFKNWVMTIAVNLTKNRFRSLFRRRRLEEEAVAMSEHGVTSPTANDPRIEAVNQAIGQLSENLRAPLVLRHMEGCSYEEIARILGIGVSAAKMRVMRARDELVQQLGTSH